MEERRAMMQDWADMVDIMIFKLRLYKVFLITHFYFTAYYRI